MKKVGVILTQPIENNTSSMIRCLGIMNELPSMGYNVVCYCPYADINGKYNDSERINKDIVVKRFGNEKKLAFSKDVQNKKIKNVLVHVAYKMFKKVDVFGASLQYLRFRKGIKEEIVGDEIDILLSFSDPMTAHMIGNYCRDVVKEEYIQQWGDPLTADTIAKTALPQWIRYIIEKKLIKKADKICYVSPFTYEEQKGLFRKYANRMVFTPTPMIKYVQSSVEQRNNIKLGYFGSYNLLARDIRPLYNAMREMQDAILYLIGDSDLELESTQNVIVENRVSQEKIEEYVADVDVLVCLMNSKGNQIPGKLYHYAGSYKEILVIKDGDYGDEIEKFFSQYKRYTFVSNDTEQIMNKISQYIRDGIPKREPLEAFDAGNVAKKVMEVNNVI